MLLSMTNLKIKSIDLKFEIECYINVNSILWNDKNARAFC